MILLNELFVGILYFLSLYFSIFFLSIFIIDDVHYKKEKPDLPNHLLPIVTVAIPAYNEEDSIVETVDSVINLDYPRDKLKIIVINDGSTDNTRQKVEKLLGNHPHIRLINQKNSGKARSLNNALKSSKSEFFTCLDADSTVTPITLKKMIKYFDNKNVAAVTPLMKVRNPKNLLQKLQKYEYLVSIFIKRLMAHIDCIYVTPGPFSIYRTSVLKKVGGFNEHTLTEDMEIAYRLQKNQYQIKQCLKDGVSYTIAPKNIKELYKQRNRWFKGSISNVFNYRNLVFNKKYGDFGMLQLPKNIFGIFAALTTIFLFLSYFIIPLFGKLHNLYLIRFNFLPYLKSINFSWGILNLQYSRLFLLLILFSISLTFIICAHIFNNEKINKKTLLPIAVLLIFYPLLLSFIYLVVILESLVGIKQKW